MKYYEMHDFAYKQLRDKNYVSWDRKLDVNTLFDHHVNHKLSPYLDLYFENNKNKVALDLGTGTGNCALYLANRGFEAHGYDISEQAIEIAKENASKLDLDATFKIKDICNSTAEFKFDLIVDSLLLHCIVYDEDRTKMYNFIKESLEENGFFYLNTMLRNDNMETLTSPSHLLFKDEILWSKGPDTWEMKWTVINGEKFFPHRRLLSKDQLISEIEQHGFELIDFNVNSGENGDPDSFSGWIKLS